LAKATWAEGASLAAPAWAPGCAGMGVNTVAELRRGLAEFSSLELANHRADFGRRAQKLSQLETAFDRMAHELARREMEVNRRVDDVARRESAVAAKEAALVRREMDSERQAEDLAQREMALAAGAEALAQEELLLHAAGPCGQAGGGAQPAEWPPEILERPDIKESPDSKERPDIKIKASTAPKMTPIMRTPTPARSFAHARAKEGGAGAAAATGAGGTGGDAAPPLSHSPKASAAPAVGPMPAPRLLGAGVAAVYTEAVSHAKPSPPPRAPPARRLSGPAQGKASKMRALFEQRASTGAPAPPAPEQAAAPAPKVSMEELLARDASALDASDSEASDSEASGSDASDSEAAGDAAPSMPGSPAAAAAQTESLDGLWGHDEAFLYS